MEEPESDRTDAGDDIEGRFADASLPTSVLEEAERLTRLARNATDPAEREVYLDRREELLAGYGYTGRVREEDDTLVCHPDTWLEDGTVRTDRIEDLSDAVEISLSGPGDPDDWAALDAHNRDLVARVREEYGGVHAANADRFADFMGNHCAKRVTAASGEEIERFLGDYYVRNAWPAPDERDVIEDSIEALFDVAGESLPPVTASSSLESGD